jgi:formylglycine-generating enzyme
MMIAAGFRAPWLLALAVAAALAAPPASAQTPTETKPAFKLLEPFRDCPTCPVMIPIGAGDFQMGPAQGEDDREKVPPSFRSTTQPAHLVRIQAPFAIGKYEVTRTEFAEFIADTDHKPTESCLIFVPDREVPAFSTQRVDRSATFSERAGFSWRNPGFRQSNDDPVVCVSWQDAKAYVAWLSRKTRQRYDLPSEAEWEYAARGTTVGARYWGEGVQDICTFANGGDLSLVRTPGVLFEKSTPFMPCDDKSSFTAPVGKLKPNAYGLHDMIGNAAEWVEDCWNDSYIKAPDDGGPWTLGQCNRRVVRGGSWFNVHSRFLRAASRVSHAVDTRVSATGFRVARRL